MKYPKIILALTAFLSLTFLAPVRGSAQTSLVNHGDSWRYHKGTNAPAANWKTAPDLSLGSSWLTGNGGFGFADNTTETQLCQTLLNDMENNYSTVYLRRNFQISSAVDTNLHLLLTMDYDDGFICWLDGAYLTSHNSPGAPLEPNYDALATASHESSRGNSSPQPAMTVDLGSVGNRLGIGNHVLAVMGLNNSRGSSDLIQVPDLRLVINPVRCSSDPIMVNTTWSASNSPVVICGNVLIYNGVTLTIEAGTTVEFGLGGSLTVLDGGRLLAEGTSNSPIHFTREGSSGNWDHLSINGSVGSPETRISHANFDFNANSTAIPCIEVAAGTARLDHLTFGNTAAPYIFVDGASFVISHCHFPSATAEFELVHGTGGIKTGGHGIFLRNFFGRSLDYSDVVDFTGGSRPSPIVHFIDNVVNGSDDDGFDLDGTDAWVEGNIFLHVHRNGTTPDSGAAVSGGSNSGLTSEITLIGNLMFDCDNGVTAKQGNFYTLINNTIIHTTKTGGIDGASGAITVRDTTPSPTTFARGVYIEGNIIWDAEQLVRNYDASQTTVTFSNNIIPFAWTGPGGGNSVVNPLLQHLPQLSETVFTNWDQAQILRDWFSLQTNSPALATGPNGKNKGGVIPLGASISGAPSGSTSQSNAILRVGINRTGNGIPASGWPSGAGYTHYKWRLDTNAWSAEIPLTTPITLNNLAGGLHYIEIVGKRDTGLYQDDPLFGEDALITRSGIWFVLAPPRLGITRKPDGIEIQFQAQENTGYTIEYRDSFSTGTWQPLIHLDPVPSPHTATYPDSFSPSAATRFYRVAIP